MAKAIDIKGKTFGRLTALKPTNNRNSKGSIMWLCECECGTIKEICISDLRSKGTKSCGCLAREKASERFKKLNRNQRYESSMKDITGERFGKLVALRPTNKRVGTNIVWEMKCDCGNITYVNTGNIGEGKRKTKSCGCFHKEVIGIDITGQRFGRLIALEETNNKAGRTAWECKCDCGNKIIANTVHLVSGRTQSCGCISKEKVGKNHPNYNPNKTDEERLNKRYVLGKQTLDGFRNKVYKRDEYTCQVCNQIGGKLNAHHLDGWNWAVDKRFDVDNGVTLCECCHSNFHSVYGNGNNTAEQFKSFKLINKNKVKQLPVI